MKNFLWTQFRLHRAVDMLYRVDVLMRKTNVAKKCKAYLEDWDPNQLMLDIRANIDNRL